jgi:phosphoribosylformylglycinamidine cyclo-ligase
VKVQSDSCHAVAGFAIDPHEHDPYKRQREHRRKRLAHFAQLQRIRRRLRLDAFKRACQQQALTTKNLLEQHGYAEPADVRGESAYLLEGDDHYLAHVEEGLGSKNLVADAMAKLTGRSFYRAIAIDTVATIVNDLVTCGAMPISVAMHAGVGASEWFNDRERASELAAGFAEGCRQANAVWGGGETPTLKGIVNADAIVLAGSAVGRIAPKSRRITGQVRDGDAIIFLASSGVQTNGLTLCRAVADRLPESYLTKMSDGRSFGEGLLEPSTIYVKFVAAAQSAGLDLHYVAHVTGHGWRKLMRLAEPFVYEIENVREPLPVFRFLQERGPIDEREMYATFNMGVGFAAYVSEGDAERCVEIAKRAGYDAWRAGRVRKNGDHKAVDIKPLGIRFDGDTLALR